MHDLYELRELLCKELKEYGSKGELNAGTLDVVDKLAHAVKNLDKIIGVDEDGYSGSYPMWRGAYADGNRGSYRGSYAGRRNARRDSMGRYSGERGYSRDGGMVEELRELMEDAPDERTRQEFQRFIQKLENM